MTFCIGRREFITLLGGAVAAWPLAARAQQPKMPVIGYLYAGAPETSAHFVAAFRGGLSEAGYVEGRDGAVEYRWAHNDVARLPELAADLVRRRVAVIVASAPVAAVAAKAATTTIPIVFRVSWDPVELGLVASLNRPGGNITGVHAMSWEIGSKRLGLLHELLPGASRFGVLVNPSDPNAEHLIRDLQAAASVIQRHIEFFNARNSAEIDVALASLVQNRPDALLVAPQSLFVNRRVQVVGLAMRHILPAIYPSRDFAEIGGLMSYGSSASEQFRLTGIYAGRVLKGEKPAEMPILRASKFELVVNLQTAKVLGIEVPATLLAAADEVIE
jgi:putative ABC transport system substrate-binding protein